MARTTLGKEKQPSRRPRRWQFLCRGPALGKEIFLLTPFLGTCPGWQDKMTVCGLQDELPMRMVADKGEVGRD